MVYYYFPTKDDLFFAVVEQVYAKLVEDMSAALSPDVTVPERLERLFARVARTTDDELLVMRLVLREALTSSARFERLMERFQRGHIALIARLVADGYATGDFKPELHPVVTMLSIGSIGVVPQLARRALGEKLPFPGAPAGEELSKVLARLVFTGVGAAGKPAVSASLHAQSSDKNEKT
jgi:AcrR family transcriptional regulator